MSRTSPRTSSRIPRAALAGAALAAGLALAATAAAQPAPVDKLAPGAAATGSENSSVGSTGQVPNVAYPQAPTATPAAEGADRARPPTEAEKAEQKVR